MTLKWNRLIGQERVKSVIGSALQSGTLGHAYLFCGERGTGKFAAAADLAMALLCQNAQVRPCGECPACKKVNAYSHPDFHVVMPLVLQTEHKKSGDLSEEGWQFAAASAKQRLDDPYCPPRYSGIPGIPVDWIREEVIHGVMRGGTEGTANVVIIDGVDTMKKEPANAMLKTLEEPPPGTVMILLTDKLHAVLPTIVSRCQIIRFALLPADLVKAELYRRVRLGIGTGSGRPGAVAPTEDVDTEKDSKNGAKKGAKKEVEENNLFGDDLFGNDLFAGADDTGAKVDADAGANVDAVPDVPFTPDPRIELAALCGSVGAAIEELEDPREEYYEAAANLWSDSARGDWEAATQGAERIAGGEDALTSCQKTLKCLIQLLRFAFFRKFAASINYINVGTCHQIDLPGPVTPGDTEGFVRLCQEALRALEARGNVTLVMVNFACTLMEMLNGEEQ